MNFSEDDAVIYLNEDNIKPGLEDGGEGVTKVVDGNNASYRGSWIEKASMSDNENVKWLGDLYDRLEFKLYGDKTLDLKSAFNLSWQAVASGWSDAYKEASLSGENTQYSRQQAFKASIYGWIGGSVVASGEYGGSYLSNDKNHILDSYMLKDKLSWRFIKHVLYTGYKIGYSAGLDILGDKIVDQQ